MKITFPIIHNQMCGYKQDTTEMEPEGLRIGSKLFTAGPVFFEKGMQLLGIRPNVLEKLLQVGN
jgi:hypothetical protein